MNAPDSATNWQRVRVAFDFPRDVEIHRREIADQIVVEADEEYETAVIAKIAPAVSS